MAYRFSAAARSLSMLATAFACATPAAAQTGAAEADIDALIEATATDDGTLALARSQVNGGDLIGAAATLERTLLVRPGAGSDGVRLYYASVLCRLDDRRRATYEIGNVRSGPDAPGWTEVRAACGDLTPPARTGGDRVTGEFSVGLAYDGDSYGALTSQFDLPLVPSLSNDGLSVTTTGRLDARFGSNGSHALYADGTFLSKDSVAGPKLDYQVGGIRLGFASDGPTSFAVGGVLRHARVLDNPFVTEYGGQASLGFATGAGARVVLAAEAVDQDYRGGAIPSTRDGMHYDLGLSYQSMAGPQRNYIVGMAFELKNADTRALGYRGGRAFAAARFPIADNGTYLGLSGTVRRVDYRDPPLGADLREWRLFTRAAVGVPLGPDGLSLEGAASYTARYYNDASGLRDYDSVGAELRFVYNFGK